MKKMLLLKLKLLTLNWKKIKWKMKASRRAVNLRKLKKLLKKEELRVS